MYGYKWDKKLNNFWIGKFDWRSPVTYSAQCSSVKIIVNGRIIVRKISAISATSIKIVFPNHKNANMDQNYATDQRTEIHFRSDGYKYLKLIITAYFYTL